MLRGLLVVACFVPACAARPSGDARPPATAHHPDWALSVVVTPRAEPLAPAPTRRGPRRVGRLSAPFAMGAPARNVLARASTETSEHDVASR